MVAQSILVASSGLPVE
jgi:hypothetical protein